MQLQADDCRLLNSIYLRGAQTLCTRAHRSQSSCQHVNKRQRTCSGSAAQRCQSASGMRNFLRCACTRCFADAHMLTPMPSGRLTGRQPSSHTKNTVGDSGSASMLRALLGGKRQVKTQAVVDAPIAPADPDALRSKLSRPPPQLLRYSPLPAFRAMNPAVKTPSLALISLRKLLPFSAACIKHLCGHYWTCAGHKPECTALVTVHDLVRTRWSIICACTL